MNQNQNDEKDSIKVSDRRAFNPDGTVRSAEVSAEVSDNQVQDQNQGTTHEEVPSFSHLNDLPPANFANFVLSLASSVQMCLGLAPNPYSGKLEKDLAQAKHSLDLMGMIQEKTKGNLSKEEDQLLQVILTDLRLRFVEEKKNG